MGEITQAEQYLIDQIRQGNSQAWLQFIERYQGRLLAYARRQISGNTADAEDVVQDVFVNFIRALNAYRGGNSLESFLFSILRRKIIDLYRKKSSSRISLIQDVYKSDSREGDSDYLAGFSAGESTASWYVRRDEHKDRIYKSLSRAILEMLEGLKKSLNFEHLKIVELLFYCQVSNTDAAAVMKMDAGRIGLVKHRCIKQIQKSLPRSEAKEIADRDLEGLLGQIWQQYRPSCPKRNTIGAFLLKTLEPEWENYVDFHLHILGCHFCQANYEDIQLQNRQKGADRLQQRIMESTVGFLAGKNTSR
ncbi:RNA polymerase sigma factor [bacterium]|nr:RNA polymerase sigma factor [candidate division CSSED10-310 bacterium]